mgnify:CR=1 FL=1
MLRLLLSNEKFLLYALKSDFNRGLRSEKHFQFCFSNTRKLFEYLNFRAKIAKVELDILMQIFIPKLEMFLLLETKRA